MRRNGDDVWGVAPTGPLGVEGVDRAAGDRSEGTFDVAGFVERVGVDRNLDATFVRDSQTRVDGCWGGAPVFVEFEAGDPTAELLVQGGFRGSVPLAEKRHVDRPLI